jgi:hypothetical protein
MLTGNPGCNEEYNRIFKGVFGKQQKGCDNLASL